MHYNTLKILLYLLMIRLTASRIDWWHCSELKVEKNPSFYKIDKISLLNRNNLMGGIKKNINEK